jgi:glycosyltransferase involved in cell wall biosynthesis
MARLAESLAGAGAEVEILSLNPRKHRTPVEGPLPIRAVNIETSLPAFSPSAPFLVARFISREFRRALDDALQRFAPDVVQIESPFMLPYARQVRGARVVLRSHNVEFRIWEGLARIERNPLRRFAMRRNAASLRAHELREMERLDAIVPISEADAGDFRRLGCTRPMHVVPCSVVAHDIPRVDSRTAGFIGSLDFRPNQDAVRRILDDLWPRVIAREPDARLSIAGSAPPEWLRRRGIGPVESAEEFMRGVAVFMAPLFAGGGMRIKVLEAMAMGKAVVATSIGAGGIDCPHLVIADDVASFADAVVRLLREPEEAARMGAAARAYVAGRYDGASLARGLLRFYQSLQSAKQ